jgi:ATP-dependent Clp protease ATP-binding subunit ClpB
MNAEKYTQKTVETLQTAQRMAEENQNQYITPEHLLYALTDQDGGLIPSCWARWAWTATAAVGAGHPDRAAAQGGRQRRRSTLSPETGRVVAFAEKMAPKAPRRVPVRGASDAGHFLRGQPRAMKQLLQSHGVTRQRFTEELAKVKTAP